VIVFINIFFEFGVNPRSLIVLDVMIRYILAQVTNFLEASTELPMLAELDVVETMPATSSADLGAAVVKMLLAVVVLVLLLWLTYWTLRRLVRYRLQKQGRHDSISILEKKMISAKTMLYLIQVENKKILIAESHLEVKRLEGLGVVLEEEESTEA